MKKNGILWVSMLLMMMVGLSGCSGDDESDELMNDQATFRTDIYSIGYSLRNENGDRATTFKEGENIIFDVTVYNTSENEIGLADERVILMGAMSIYRSNGEYVGNPWLNAFDSEELRWIIIEANGRLHWSWPWKYDERYVHDDRFGSSTSYSYDVSYSFNVFYPLNSLPKGTYYCMIKGTVLKRFVGKDNYGSDNIEMKIPFTVK